MTRVRTAVLISGRGSNLMALLAASAATAYPAEIVLVVSNVESAAGLNHARTSGIATHVLPHEKFARREDFDAALNAVLEQANIQLICLAGFMRILSDGFVEKWKGRLINIHPSLLPSFKGIRVHERAIESGVRISGCTVHYVTPEMDSGPPIAQAAVPVHYGDTADTLAERVLAAEHRLYPAALKLVAEGRVQLEAGSAVFADYSSSGDVLINPPDGPTTP